ncbi:hypothetical protein VH567_07105 [Sphingomonas sp. 4RDLI-65]|uniref:hypothetical protein n=1 Tax=Sphingomonas sp. 4RDLI-65 TaxID=3111641 RepID=UPI003C215865
MIRMQRLLLAASLAVSVWMAYWAGEYVSLANSRSYEQHLISAQFEPIDFPPDAAGLIDEASYSSQIRESQTLAASNSKNELKRLGPAIHHAKIMLIDVPRWVILAIALAGLVTLVGSYRFKLEKRT